MAPQEKHSTTSNTSKFLGYLKGAPRERHLTTSNTSKLLCNFLRFKLDWVDQWNRLYVHMNRVKLLFPKHVSLPN